MLGILILASAIAVRLPVMTAHVRILLLVTLFFTIFTGFVFLSRYIGNHPNVLYPIVVLFFLVMLWGALANKPYDSQALRDAYQRRLEEFVGVKYVWGGESTFGVDCSGLARTALWQGMLRQGVKEANPRLLGSMLWNFWWHDVSARDMLRGKYGYTRPMGKTDKLAGYTNHDLKVGDLAITNDGVHVLVYYGDNKWIEASPDDKKVVINEATAGSRRPYFNMAVTLIRWRAFDPPKDANSDH